MKIKTSNTKHVLTSDEINLVSGGGVNGGIGPVSQKVLQFEDMWGNTMSHEAHMDWIIGQVPPVDDPHRFP